MKWVSTVCLLATSLLLFNPYTVARTMSYILRILIEERLDHQPSDFYLLLIALFLASFIWIGIKWKDGRRSSRVRRGMSFALMAGTGPAVFLIIMVLTAMSFDVGGHFSVDHLRRAEKSFASVLG